MSNCTSCGVSLTSPFSLDDPTGVCEQCSTGGLLVESAALPTTSCCVSSVNGETGAVVLTISDIDLEGNEFFTQQLVWESLQGTSPIAFDSQTGVISHLNSGVSAGTYGSSTEVPVLIIDAHGHIVGASVVSIGSIALGADLTAIEALSGTGFLVRTGTNTWALRTLQGTTGQITISDADGVANPPTIGLEVSGVTAGVYGGAASYPVITVDAYGRIISAVTTSIPPPVIPAHTHTLGDLSNVKDDVDTGGLGALLYWNDAAGEWQFSSLLLHDITSTYVLQIDGDSAYKGLRILNSYDDVAVEVQVDDYIAWATTAFLRATSTYFQFQDSAFATFFAMRLAPTLAAPHRAYTALVVGGTSASDKPTLSTFGIQQPNSGNVSTRGLRIMDAQVNATKWWAALAVDYSGSGDAYNIRLNSGYLDASNVDQNDRTWINIAIDDSEARAYTGFTVTTPLSTIDNGGSTGEKIQNVDSANPTLDHTATIIVFYFGVSGTVTLPTVANRVYYLVNYSGGTVTLSASVVVAAASTDNTMADGERWKIAYDAAVGDWIRIL